MTLDPAVFARLTKYLEARSLDAALLSDPGTVTWLTGYAPPIESGPNPFEAWTALAWVADGTVTLILSDAEAPRITTDGITVVDYAGYTIEGPVTAFANQAAVLKGLLRRHASTSRIAIGYEPDTMPVSLLRAAESGLPMADWHALDDGPARLRAVKTAAELARLRRALALCDLAQARFRSALRPGVTEIDLWNEVRAAVEHEAGGRIPALVDVVSGPRAADIGGPPTSKQVGPGDSVILDVVLRLDGCWGDTAGTWFAGEPSADLARAYRFVRDALRRGIDAVRPGIEAGELDSILRDGVAGYAPGTSFPHHAGHGLGATYHDPPRIVPYESMILEPGMVITLEPGIYLPGVGGVRLEDVVLVTADSCEVLTHHLEGDSPLA